MFTETINGDMECCVKIVINIWKRIQIFSIRTSKRGHYKNRKCYLLVALRQITQESFRKSFIVYQRLLTSNRETPAYRTLTKHNQRDNFLLSFHESIYSEKLWRACFSAMVAIIPPLSYASFLSDGHHHTERQDAGPARLQNSPEISFSRTMNSALLHQLIFHYTQRD